MEGKASIGPLSQSCIVAYDPDSRTVRYMCATSMGEVHDHRGRWTDEKTVEFEPLEGSLRGAPMTETIRWTFPDAKTIVTRTEVALKDGLTLSFEFNGTRQ